MRTLSACPLCGDTNRTPVCEYNGLVLIEAKRDADVSRYEYALCSGCGLVYATRRPVSDEYTALLRDFDENLGRPEPPVPLRVPPHRSEREELLADLRDGPLRELPARSDPTWMAWKDRGVAEPHLDFLEASLDLRGGRVLDVRSRSGWLLDALHRRHGADVYAMPAFEAHGEFIRELFGIPAEGVLDFERMEIPYEGEFDLIVAMHMFTHALHPDSLLDLLRSRLRPGGHLYLYQENDDARLQRRKNLFGEMKCFHFQNFDGPTLERCLRHRGLRPISTRHPSSKSPLAVLARAEEHLEAPAIPAEDLEERLEGYRRWRDLSILSLPGPVQRSFPKKELKAARRGAMRRGDARRTQGTVAPVNPLKLMHATGYAELNRRPSPPAKAEPSVPR